MTKAKQFMDKGDMESAKIIAAEAIRYGKEANSLHRMAGKMSAVSSKLDSAVRTQQVSQQIKTAVPSLQNALKQMEKSGIHKNMASFEKVFEDLDVKTEDITGAISNATADTADSDAVNQLLQQMQADAALNAGVSIGNVNQNQIANPNAVAAPAQADDVSDMERRLAALR